MGYFVFNSSSCILSFTKKDQKCHTNYYKHRKKRHKAFLKHITIEIIFLIRIVGQIIQLLNKENNYGLIIIRISNVLGILLIALAFIQNPIHEMNRVKDKYWNYYPIYLVTAFIDLILEVLLRHGLYKKEEKL